MKSHKTMIIVAAIVCVGLPLLYLGFFGLIYLDEAVFGTRWLSKLFPASGRDVVRALYAPLLK